MVVIVHVIEEKRGHSLLLLPQMANKFGGGHSRKGSVPMNDLRVEPSP